MHVPLENTYALGDGMNDISMLKMAGHSIAMGNGQEAVKEAAEYVTTGINEDGVWNGLKHYHLI
jgi:hydroxymethylpyrimidine pyrophosphatase-like HAD family hydrolase